MFQSINIFLAQCFNFFDLDPKKIKNNERRSFSNSKSFFEMFTKISKAIHKTLQVKI